MICRKITSPLGLLLLLLSGFSFSFGQDNSTNSLTAAEKKAGWKLLFNGKTFEGWRTYKNPAPPQQGWKIEKGVLTHILAGKGGDIMTERDFDSFELSWEWSMPPKSNNGIKYFITTERGAPIGHEYQMIDDSLVEKDTLSSCGSFYLVVSPKSPKNIKPWGEWNLSRVLVQGNHVEHWLNGQKLLEYECGDPKILAQVQTTKFKEVKGFGSKVRGHILLTSHNDEASFRNIKIRELPGK
jgi:hypothetical protein